LDPDSKLHKFAGPLQPDYRFELKCGAIVLESQATNVEMLAEIPPLSITITFLGLTLIIALRYLLTSGLF